ncbi:MAG: glycosyltransferase [Eubacterium sp.]|jgi:glycosyltransferase involved in cell wall biosynthesis|nr:glycosyltransferase [Eubacterium sp.]
MDIVIMHQTVTKHDAIGNDIEAMYLLLKQKHNCFVYAENQFNTVVQYVDEKQMDQIIQKTDCVVIYHHSVYWSDGYHILKRVKGKIIFRYHNITPASFFEKYNQFHTKQCAEGRRQTEQFVEEFPKSFWMPASHYNTGDLTGVQSDRIAVCPPFHKVEQWGMEGIPDEKILKELIEDRAINLLFVGRVAPNKGHIFLLDILRAFRTNYSEKVKLRIVGKFDDGLATYNRMLLDYINEYKLKDSVEFIGEINDATLLAYYLGSDMMVCASEHEGFCVPIVEAQYMGLPILALRECAVPETIGKEQLVLEKRPEVFAAAIHVLQHHSDYREYVVEKGIQNVQERFSQASIRKCFLKAFEKGVQR